MSEFQQQILNYAAKQTAPGLLAQVRERGHDHWRLAAWPNRRTEAWKYTPLNALNKSFADTQTSGKTDGAAAQAIAIDAYRLVFVNGIFDANASSVLPGAIVRFTTADDSAAVVINQYIGTLADGAEHLFASMNEATLTDGVLIHLADNAQLDKPVYIQHVTDEAEPGISSVRVLAVLGKNARVEIIEQYLTNDEAQQGFVSAETEIFLKDNARCDHYRLNLEDENISHVGGVYIELKRDAHFRGFALAKGSALMRINYGVFHRGEGAHADLQGAYLPRNKQLVDYHTNVQHCVAHCTTNEVFRGIIGDSAKAVFNGRIHIHPDAQKTLAELSNKNLLTSNRAEVDTKPELEIYADDVRCAHGATVAQLNDEALYYLQSRGIAKSEARVMLSFGFVNELLGDLANRDIANYLMPELAAQFGRDEQLLLAAGADFE